MEPFKQALVYLIVCYPTLCLFQYSFLKVYNVLLGFAFGCNLRNFVSCLESGVYDENGGI